MKKTLELAQEMIFHPAFKQKDFDKVKKQVIGSIRHASVQPRSIASNAYQSVLYVGTSMGVSSSGSMESISSINLEQVKKYYTDYFSLAKAQVSIVSNVDEDKLIPMLSFLKDSKVPQSLPAPKDPLQIPSEPVIYFVDKPGAPQSELRVGRLDIKYDATGEYYKAGLMNYVFGGAFNSRINLNLREDKGYTYGAFSYFSGGEHYGKFTIQTGVKAASTKESLKEIFKEVENYAAHGITEDELKFTRSITQREALKYETPNQKLRLMSPILKYGLDPKYTSEQYNILENITKSEIDALAAKHLDLNKMVIVVVGDKKKYFKEVKSLGYKTKLLEAGKYGIYKEVR